MKMMMKRIKFSVNRVKRYKWWRREDKFFIVTLNSFSYSRVLAHTHTHGVMTINFIVIDEDNEKKTRTHER
jgi:hypothetical protein